MDSKHFILIGYFIIGIIFILFNKQISNFIYKLVLFYTNKLKLDELFLFKVDSKNRNSMTLLTKLFTFLLGLIIILISIYEFY